ncbi:MAG: DUF2851 family protein [Prevotellaceae bacterium]|jgi:hypothetical protein|nr:DUF2851 family protein [Prevotellaceae bacterium]
MSEQFLQYIWFKRLFSVQQQTTDGQAVEIIDVGQRNTDAGPDVFNAKIKIGGTVWAGNVEFHIAADDWQQHNHNGNKAYDSVILHIVLKAGKNATRTDGKTIPQMVLNFSKRAEEEFEAVSLPFIKCASELIESSCQNLAKTFEMLVNERLMQRLLVIENLLTQTAGDWEEAFYITVARSFGFGTNADAFEQLARNLPQKIPAKHKDNLLQIEAILFGTAGFLENFEPKDAYSQNLLTEYQYFKHKFGLKNIDKSLWKFLRLRPTNFPTVRIAQFASLIHISSKLFSKILEQKNLKNLLALFMCEPSEYWQNHYILGKEAKTHSKKLSKSSAEIILINSIIPFLFCYGKKYNNLKMSEFALDLLKKIPAEKNHITSGFAFLGIEVKNAFESQALAQLKNLYCNRRDCCKCRQKFHFFEKVFACNDGKKAPQIQ